MKYRKMDTCDETVSLLGFGCMRFPMLEDGSIDEAKAEKMIDYAISKGVNYIDTAYPYHDGESEPFVGKVLKKYDRSSFYLATKLPIWKVETREDVRRIFEEQLARLDVEYVDFYLLHALNKERWDLILDLKILDIMEELKQEGKIKHLGFSFHDSYPVFEEIISYRKWDFCQIQYNYMDTTIQAGDKGYELAKKLGIPLVIMEPLKGGMLTRLPEDIDQVIKDFDKNATQASLALRWVASHDNVKVVLSGMSDESHVTTNIDTFENFKPLTKEEVEVVNKIKSILGTRQKNGCTACGYCMPCPFGVNIPKNFQYWNEASMYLNPSRLTNGYKSLKDACAASCKQCGLCETMCPQNISIRDDLQAIVKEIEG